MSKRELPAAPSPERGPEGRRASGDTERDPLEPVENPYEREDFSILNVIQGRLIKKSPFAEPILGLEILDGPYRGVVFSFQTFTLMPGRRPDGTVPVRFETEVHIVPDHLKNTFTADEDFDRFTSEVVVSWLAYLHLNDLSPLLKMKPFGPTQ